MTITIGVDDVLASVLRRLKGEPLELGLARLIRDYVERRIGECDVKVKEYESKYVSFERLEGKILNEGHEWGEEGDLFEWEATLTESRRLEEIRRTMAPAPRGRCSEPRADSTDGDKGDY